MSSNGRPRRPAFDGNNGSILAHCSSDSTRYREDDVTPPHSREPPASYRRHALAIAAPHSGTPLDLLHTAGTAAAVLGGSLLLVAALRDRWRWVVLPVAAAGSMTLTLYSVHVFALAAVQPHASTGFWWLNVALALLAATAWQAGGHRGPLEGAASRVSDAARRAHP